MKQCEVREQLNEQVAEAQAKLFEFKDTIGAENKRAERKAKSKLNHLLMAVHSHVLKHGCTRD